MKLFTHKPKEYRYVLKLDKYDCNILIRALDDYRKKAEIHIDNYNKITGIISNIIND